jgi:hypothetical protein
MQQLAHTAPAPQPLLFLPSVFNETLDLLFDAHNYFQARGAEEQSLISPRYRPMYAHEMSRITMRLTSIMAWIMVRKAVSAGKIDDDTAGEKYRLDAADICLGGNPELIDELPYYIGYLSLRSRELYERVWRLDEMAYGTRH